MFHAIRFGHTPANLNTPSVAAAQPLHFAANVDTVQFGIKQKIGAEEGTIPQQVMRMVFNASVGNGGDNVNEHAGTPDEPAEPTTVNSTPIVPDQNDPIPPLPAQI